MEEKQTNSQEEETVTISKTVYNKLLEDHRFLTALEHAGVDNWEGYDIAFELLESE